MGGGQAWPGVVKERGEEEELGNRVCSPRSSAVKGGDMAQSLEGMDHPRRDAESWELVEHIERLTGRGRQCRWEGRVGELAFAQNRDALIYSNQRGG